MRKGFVPSCQGGTTMLSPIAGPADRGPGKRTILASIVLICLFSAAAFAQNSGVSGSVSDQSNALIPGVTVTATNIDTGVVVTNISNEAGTYNFVSLQPGNYKMTASLPGFQTQ